MQDLVSKMFHFWVPLIINKRLKCNLHQFSFMSTSLMWCASMIFHDTNIDDKRYKWKEDTTFRAHLDSFLLLSGLKQDRRWNADKPSAALDPYMPTWLTTSPANHRPANFWFFFFFFFTFKGNCEKWCNLRSNCWASTSNLKFPFSDSFKYK